MKASAILSLLLLLAPPSDAEEGKFKRYGYGIGWIGFEYPANFVKDPESHQGELKWWARFDDPDSDLIIETNSFGYISQLDLLMSVPGYNLDNYIEKSDADGRPADEIIATDGKYKTAGDYFRANVAPKDSEVSKAPGYERYISRFRTGVNVYILYEDAYEDQHGGKCFLTLSFKFPEGSYAKHRETIEAVIRTARPGGMPAGVDFEKVGNTDEKAR